MKISSFVCVALALGGVACARPAAAVRSRPSGAAAGAGTDSSVPQAQPALAEVVVTAEKRTTNLQRTAVSATVLTGVQLLHAGVVDVDQLENIAPSLTVNDFGQGADFNIRGIGEGEHNTQPQPGVITSRDGVADLSLVPNEPYYDISHIQILRGPQGTFAGAVRGTVNGAEAALACPGERMRANARSQSSGGPAFGIASRMSAPNRPFAGRHS